MTGPYGFYIAGAYAVTGLAVLLLVAWTAWDYRVQARALTRLERRAAGEAGSDAR